MKKRCILCLFILLVTTSSAFAYVYQGNIDFYDFYQFQSTSSDAITWLEENLLVRLLNTPTGTQAICWDWDGDGTYTACWGISENAIEDCSAEFSEMNTVCTTAGCGVANIAAWHDMWVSRDLIGNEGEGHSMKVKYYRYCNNPGSVEAGEPTNNGAWFYILSQRQYRCISQGGLYKDHGYYGDGWKTITSSISCSANYGCDIDKDRNWADFGYHGISLPNTPCSLLNGQSCSIDSNCVYYCSPDGNVCVSDECGDIYCDTGSGEWCADDPCGTCGGGTCNTCNQNQCPSYFWYYEKLRTKINYPYCFNNNNLCCVGDDVFGQYYCKNDETWAVCNSQYHHIGEQMSGTNYYCTYQGGVYMWRECPSGCCTSSTCNSAPTEANIVVSPSSLTFEIGYGEN